MRQLTLSDIDLNSYIYQPKPQDVIREIEINVIERTIIQLKKKEFGNKGFLVIIKRGKEVIEYFHKKLHKAMDDFDTQIKYVNQKW